MSTQTRTIDRARLEDEAPGGSLKEGSSSSLLSQARTLEGVAREAYRNCRKNAEAEAELFRRRNNSGQ